MKREKLVALLLSATVALSVLNLIYLSKLCNGIIREIEFAENMAENEQFASALDILERALYTWDKNSRYTGIFLKQTDNDAVNNCFYELMCELLRGESEAVPALCAKLKYQLKNIRTMESLRLESIF